jgi:hypothetical protein
MQGHSHLYRVSYLHGVWRAVVWMDRKKDNGFYMSCTWTVGWFGKIATLFQIDTRTPLKKNSNKTKQLVTKRCQLEPWQILWNLRTRLRSKPLASLAFKWSMCSVGQVRLRKCSEGPVLLYIHISPCGSIQWCERIERYWKSHKDCSILSLFWVCLSQGPSLSSLAKK